MNTTKRELYRLMLFIKYIFKEYNSRLIEVIVQHIVPLSLLFLQIHNWVNMRSIYILFLYNYGIIPCFIMYFIFISTCK